MSQIVVQIEGHNRNESARVQSVRHMPKFRDLSESGRQERPSYRQQQSYVQCYIRKVCGSGGIL